MSDVKRNLKIVLVVFLIALLSFGIGGIVSWQIIINKKPIEVELWMAYPILANPIILNTPHTEGTPVLEVEYDDGRDYLIKLSRFVQIHHKDSGFSIDTVKCYITSTGFGTPRGEQLQKKYSNEAIHPGQYHVSIAFNSPDGLARNFLNGYKFTEGTLLLIIV